MDRDEYPCPSGRERQQNTQTGVSPKKKQLAEYLRENPGVNNKSYLARQLGMAITTVQKYYDEVRAELRGEESPAPQT